MKEEICNYTENGECSNCGQCCSNFLPISQKDINAIKRYIRRYGIQEQIRRYPTTGHFVDMVCPFRDEIEKRCTIYPVRPEICKSFRCDQPKEVVYRAKKMYHVNCDIVDIRAEFFKGETGLGKDLTKLLMDMGQAKMRR